ncbi:MAG: hypothetical protein ACO1O1_05175 [Adhaeribacter sp.]
MKTALTFTASPSLAALRLLAFDSSAPKSGLGRLYPGAAPLLAPPAPGIYNLQPASNTGPHYFYHLQLRVRGIPGESGQPDAFYPLSPLPGLSWLGDW